ncbi:uncharacterized protein Z518_10692 [Rhinocladiella mackenziei CBS 650.93]|uniref:Rhinocladiella mackenziei CBS 650.93 unplaced genomic scaffold supercont1.10, whole genome shotgun sequence n=1 Tax=Rhinocladiella mackenziei CBS 650.93 TaxID=1442369 RepID=A0A0D2ISL7_9EURO|nr:uncharacterized protein Z518_10692 [Rhinocladiella mackenziei CBS 650.93]KIW99764.1 hypothetical protein Z518_10692 [Rhinocladiella mackenziei CBS 650.93]
MPVSNGFVVFLPLLSLLVVTSVSQNSCGTDQNPYCAGNDVFEQLCCPYPNVCYWQNRDGAPGCCPAGQVCDGDTPYYTPVSTLQPTTITASPTPTPTSTPAPTSQRTVVSTFVGGGGVVVVTSQNNVVTTTTDDGNGAYSTVTSNIGSVYSTVTSSVIGVYSTVTSVVGGAYTTVTSDIGQGFATVSGVLVAPAPRSSMITLGMPVMACLLVVAWNFVG